MNSETIYVHVGAEDGTSRLVGRFGRTMSDTGRVMGSFDYVGSWLRSSSSFALDPVNMPLVRHTLTTTKREGVFGPLADALPDRWGRRLIALDHGGILSPVKLLLMSGPNRVGCLSFSQTPNLDPSPETVPQAADLGRIAIAFERIQQNEKVDPEIRALYRAGISLGGARPKTLVTHEGRLWLAKFERHDDEWDQCAAEHSTMKLAGEAGIQVPRTRVLELPGRKVLLVERFDRSHRPNGGPTAHFASALSLLDLSETSEEGSYQDLAAVIRRHSTVPGSDGEQLFRRMVFNVMVGNRDDHLKNHAMVRIASGWRLSPAYDIVPQPDMDPVQAIAIGSAGGIPRLSNLTSRLEVFGVTHDRADAIIESVGTIVSRWEERYAADGVDDQTMERIAPAFDPGLEISREPRVGPKA